MKLLTVSEIRTYRCCPREHHYRYNLGYRSVERASALRFGSLIHVGQEAWWAASGDRWENTESAMAQAATDPKCTVDSHEYHRAVELMRAYHLRWAGESWEVVAVEQQFDCPLINPETGYPSKVWRLAGVIDLLLRDPEQRHWIAEHKSSSADISAGSDYWKLLQLDNQVSTYFVGARSLGHDVIGCLYDVLGKPAIKPSQIPIIEDGAKVVLDHEGKRVRTKDGKKWRETADSTQGYVLQTRPELPEEYGLRVRETIASEPYRYLVRGTVVRLEQEEQDAMWDTWTTAHQIHEGNKARQWPRNTNGCKRWNRMCDYWEVCTGTASLEDETKYTLLADPHEELSRPVAA